MKMKSAQAEPASSKEVVPSIRDSEPIEIPPEVLDDPLLEIEYYDVPQYTRIPLPHSVFKKKWEAIKRGEIKGLEPEFEGLFYFTLLTEEIVPCIILKDELYYLEEHREAIEHKLEVGKNEIYVEHLFKYKAIPLKQLDELEFQNLARKYELKVFLLPDVMPEGIELWVCEPRKEFYCLEKYLPEVTNAIEDAQNPGFF